MSVAIRRDVVILACAISAGIHGALAPNHFREGAAVGVAFVAATAVLGLLAVALTRRPSSDALHALASLVLAGIVAGYAAAVTTGVPLLHPEPEPVDRLALATKAIEIAGAVTALTLLPFRHRVTSPYASHPNTKGTPA